MMIENNWDVKMKQNTEQDIISIIQCNTSTYSNQKKRKYANE